MQVFSFFFGFWLQKKFCFVIFDYGLISDKRSFKRYSEKHGMIDLDDFISLPEGKNVYRRFSIDCTKTFEVIKIPHRVQICLDCCEGNVCNDCLIKPKMNWFNCQMKRAFKSCLDPVNQEKTYSTDLSELKRHPPNEKHQILLWYVGEYKPKTSNLNFMAGKEFLICAGKPKIEIRRFETINDMIECKSYMKNEDVRDLNRYLFVDSKIIEQIKLIILS